MKIHVHIYGKFCILIINNLGNFKIFIVFSNMSSGQGLTVAKRPITMNLCSIARGITLSWVFA